MIHIYKIKIKSNNYLNQKDFVANNVNKYSHLHL